MRLEEDKLKREVFLSDLFALFENFGKQEDRGLTMIINGRYGSGKSTLLDFIQEKNGEENKFNIVRYNAWENNLFDNPLIPILYAISKLEDKGKRIKAGAKKILKNLPKAILSTLANAHSVDFQPFINNENVFEDYDKYLESLKKFKNVLKECCEKKKTIMLIDELDRCLPDYQIKVLECIYHLLDIPNLIVVIALDKEQLESAIKDKFGESLDTHSYLAKFIQYEIDLPEGNKYEHLKQLMKFKTKNIETTKNLIEIMFRAIKMPLRECQQIVNEINLICNEKDGSGEQVVWFYYRPVLVGILLIMRKIDNKLYRKYFDEAKEPVHPFPATKTQLKQSEYGKFLSDLNGTNTEKIIKMLLKNDYGKSFILHFINSFQPIACLYLDDLATYTKIEKERVEAIILNGEGRMVEFPSSINRLIEKLKIIK